MARANIDLYNIGTTPEELRAALIQMRAEFDAHQHDGSSSKSFETVQAETVSARTILIRKTSYADAAAGIWMGENAAGTMLLKLGNASNYLQWDGSSLTIVGALTATSGTIGGWTINSTSLTGGGVTLSSTGIITGGVIRTSSSGARVQMNDSGDNLEVYDSGGTRRMELDSDELTFYNSAGNELGSITTPTTTNLVITTTSGNFLVFDLLGALGAAQFQVDGTSMVNITAAGLEVDNGALLAGDATTDIGSSSQGFRYHYFEDVTSNPTTNGQMVYYNSGGSEGLRMQFGGSDFQFDASGV